jgi:hypothetical protein
MIVPGSNILAMALRVIASQVAVNYFSEVTPRVRQANGAYLSTYNAPVTLTRQSVQPVPRDRYQALGLDFMKSYITWYVPNLQFDAVKRNQGGDVIEWPVNPDGSLIAGQTGRYQLVGDNPWKQQDNWASALCILIGPGTGALNNG